MVRGMLQGILKDNYIYAYYQKLRDGSIVAGKYVHMIYEYLVTGLQEKWFAFDLKRATMAIEWVEGHCFHTEGVLAPGPLKLELWQKAMLSAIFGIIDANGNRQFREVVLVVARKKGKICDTLQAHRHSFWICQRCIDNLVNKSHGLVKVLVNTERREE